MGSLGHQLAMPGDRNPINLPGPRSDGSSGGMSLGGLSPGFEALISTEIEASSHSWGRGQSGGHKPEGLWSYSAKGKRLTKAVLGHSVKHRNHALAIHSYDLLQRNRTSVG